MLHTLNLNGWQHTSWCVPSAIAMITGAPVAHMHSRAAMLLNKKLTDVKGVYSQDAILLLREQGYKTIPIDLKSRHETPATIRNFFKTRTKYEYCMPIMFATANHMMTCHMNYAGDNWTTKPVPIETFPKLNRKVLEAWIVYPS